MRYEKRNLKNGVYYSFLYWCPKTKKRVRLRKSEVPNNITTDAQADDFCKIKEAELAVVSLKVKRDLAWKHNIMTSLNFLSFIQINAKSKLPILGRQISIISSSIYLTSF